MAAEHYESLRLLVKNSRSRMGSAAEVAAFVCAFMPLVVAAVGGSTARALCGEFGILCEVAVQGAYAAALERYCLQHGLATGAGSGSGAGSGAGAGLGSAAAGGGLPPSKRSRTEQSVSAAAAALLPQGGAQSVAASVAAQLMCCVCHALALAEPCAAPCGHICCRDCWTRLLRVRSQCPLCKRDVAREDIVSVVLRG